MFRTNPEKAIARQKITEWYAKQPHGRRVSWLEIEAETGVSMKSRPTGKEVDGRALVRSVVGPKVTIHGNGIELSSPENSASIAEDSNLKVFSSIRSLVKQNTTLQQRHGAEMTAQQRDRFTVASCRTAMLMAVVKPTHTLGK